MSRLYGAPRVLTGGCVIGGQVWFSMQGEMSATVLYFPKEYTRLQREIKERLLVDHPPAWAQNIKVTPPLGPPLPPLTHFTSHEVISRYF